MVRRYLGMSTDIDPMNADSFSSRQFFTKSLEWKYEKECRVIANVKMLEQGEYVPFKKGSLAAIYLGCRMAELQARRVLDI